MHFAVFYDQVVKRQSRSWVEVSRSKFSSFWPVSNTWYSKREQYRSLYKPDSALTPGPSKSSRSSRSSRSYVCFAVFYDQVVKRQSRSWVEVSRSKFSSFWPVSNTWYSKREQYRSLYKPDSALTPGPSKSSRSSRSSRSYVCFAVFYDQVVKRQSRSWVEVSRSKFEFFLLSLRNIW